MSAKEETCRAIIDWFENDIPIHIMPKGRFSNFLLGVTMHDGKVGDYVAVENGTRTIACVCMVDIPKGTAVILAPAVS